MKGEVDVLEANFTEKEIVVFSNEPEGVSDEVTGISDKRMHIPGSGEIDSLNVSVAAGIILGKLFEQKKRK